MFTGEVIIEQPHRRFNALTGEWVLVSPHRTKRPWQGKTDKTAINDRPEYDPNCYLCPGNTRAGGHQNSDYKNTFVFTNDFAALLPDSPIELQNNNDLFAFESVQGTCKVICFSPRHDLSLAEMSHMEISSVVDVWTKQINELAGKYKWIQIFENKGDIMGCSNPHPHGQIWASNNLPNEPLKEDRHQLEYYQKNKTILLRDYLNKEIELKDRMIVENEHWAAVVPFWAIWPFETILIPKRHVLRLPDLHDQERVSLARILKNLLAKYDNLFEISFPYTMGWHGAPTDDGDYTYWQLHAHFYPPLLRSATVKKFMVGYEMLAEAQRDITPEQAAERLRDLSDIHYKTSL